MTVKRALVGGLVAGLLAFATAAGASHTPWPGSVSWADGRRGWAPNHEQLCKPTGTLSDGARVCATEDGGRTWRTIFVGGNYIFTALRTSARAGIVSSGAYGHTQFWTRDNGRHWYGTVVAGGSGGFNARHPAFAGRGEHLYWVRAFEDTVYRVTPWPPTAPVSCPGRWARSAFFEEDADPGGNHCQGGAVEAGMSSTPVVSGHGPVARFALVPGGVLVLTERSGRLTSIVHRDGENLVRELPRPRLPEDAGDGFHLLRVAWPAITVTGRYGAGEEARDTWHATWRSSDGGASWRMELQRGWSGRRENPIPRAGTAAGVVGEEIVLAGGRYTIFGRGPSRTGAVSRLAQAYRPADDSWRDLPDLPAAVGYAAGASDGRALYVVGGFDGRGRPQRTAFAFRDGHWRALPRAPEPRAAAGAAVVGDKLYVLGGIGPAGLARRALILDLRRNRWSTVGGPRPRAYLAAAAVRDRIVVAGGRTAGPGTSVAFTDSWRPGDRKWKRQPPLPSARSEAAAVAVDGELIVLGGAVTEHHQPIGSVVALGLGARSWRVLPGLRTPRYGLAAGELHGRLYALVGGDGDGPEDRGTLAESLSLAP